MPLRFATSSAPPKQKNAFSFSISRRKWARSIGFLTAPLCISFRLQAAVFGCYRQTSGFSLHQNLRHGTRVERTRVMPAGIAVDATPATRLPPTAPALAAVVSRGRGSHRSQRRKGREQQGGTAEPGAEASRCRTIGQRPRVVFHPRRRRFERGRSRRSRPEDPDEPRRAAQLRGRAAQLAKGTAEEPPRAPGHEHEGEKKKPTTPLRPPSLSPHIPRPYRRVSDLKPSLTVASHPPNHSQREQSTMRSDSRSPRACQRGECERAIAAPPNSRSTRASDRRTNRAAPHTVP